LDEELKEYARFRETAEQHAFQGLIFCLLLIAISTSRDMKLGNFGIAESGFHNGLVAAYGGVLVAIAFARFYIPYREAYVLRNLLQSSKRASLGSKTDRFFLRPPFAAWTWSGTWRKLLMVAPIVIFAGFEALFSIWLFTGFSYGGKRASWWSLLLTDWDGMNTSWKFQSSPVYLNTPFHTWIQVGLTLWLIYVAYVETRRVWSLQDGGDPPHAAN